MASSSTAVVPKMKLKAAAVHAAPVFMDKKATTAKVVRIIEEAGKQGIKLLGFPETFIPGYPYFCEAYPPIQQVGALAKYADESVVCDASDASMRSVQAACRAAGVTVSLGVSERMPGGGYTLFNSQVVVDSDGAILGVHRKLQPTYAERFVWAQGGGWSLRVVRPKLNGGGGGSDDGDGGGGGAAAYNLGGLCCWENTLNGARQALIDQNQHVHVGAWPALSTMRGFEPVADAQIEALMKTHALTAQAFVLTASNYVDQQCLDWMEANLGQQDFVKAGGGWSAVIHPFCSFLAGPHTGSEEKLVTAELDFKDLGPVKVWIDGNGHYKRPEILDFKFNTKPLWPDEGVAPKFPEPTQREASNVPKNEQDRAMPEGFEAAWSRTRGFDR
ncbi:Nitrilase cyanide hydratase conserved site [Lasiodiplodia theobromae]|uniref:Nitrilase cyanide hydratase conserved site n=1 Tax=Lasiodiplodia theobromae TaxID=45133 RepID=UPI0015C3F741|nr:Nitrilase cyanide hydratase conserved site [Lasiodiplodia theobromae]KAF4542123.1 Nitrilase cyanide hydratase conserved site [Lasiodiplodia theobromae]